MSDQNSEQIELLKEIAKWMRFVGFKQVKDVLTSTLDNEKKILAYHLSDGKNTSTIISQLTGINQPRISEFWKEWLSLGLGESISASGGSRFKKSFDLKMFGVVVPEIKMKSEDGSRTSDTQQTEGSEIKT